MKNLILKKSFLIVFLLICSSYSRVSRFEHIELFPNKKNWHYRIPSIITTKDGTIIAICNRRIGTVGDDAKSMDLVIRKSTDNGNSWSPIITLASKSGWGMTLESSIVDMEQGTIFILFSGTPNTDEARANTDSLNDHLGKMVIISEDNGENWRFEKLNINPNSFGQLGNCHGSGTGITLKYGQKKGRLLLPARFAVTNEDGKTKLERDHYNCAIYSDDHGKTWQTSEPLQNGTGEGCLVELIDGTIYYNSRAYHNDGKRRIGFSYNEGESYTDFSTSNSLKECNGGTNASLLAITSKDQSKQLILFANPPVHRRWKNLDLDRKKLTLKISTDQAKTWKFSKRIFRGPSGYSSMTRTMDGKILILYEKGLFRYNDSGISLTKMELENIIHKKAKDF